MVKTLRCAIYTRKSSEEGLEQEFNSLHAQREACEAFIKSQKHEGWQLVKTPYDDGGISGGTMERPGLKQLLDDIRARKVDVVVVYKVDRLTRSLADFAKMVEVFDANNISFVSVTQQFNTTSSMGRLTLNVLLSFAQFEREVTGERIRDKFAASAKKGIWMGGNIPLGYGVKDRKLFIKPDEAEIIRHIYRRYLELGCVRLLHKDVASSGIRSVSGNVMWRSVLYKLLLNPIYVGQIRHKGTCYPGQHEAIIDQVLWDQVQQHMAFNRKGSKTRPRKSDLSPLQGKLFNISGERLIPVHANKKGRRYRYYVSQSLIDNPKDEAMNGWRLPGQEIEQTVAQAAKSILQDREAIATALHDAGIESKHVPATLKALSDVDPSTILETFVDRIEISRDGIRLILSLASIVTVKNVSVRIIRDIPMRMKRRGVEMRMVIGGSGPARIDPVLVRAIARAQGWIQELFSGNVPNMATIALRESMDKGSLSRMINLAFLAPDIVEAITEGRQPADMTLQKLMRETDLPLDWAEQKCSFGY